MRDANSERVAVYDNDGLHVEGYDQPLLLGHNQLSFLLSECRRNRITQVWICPRSNMSIAPELWYEEAREAGWHLPDSPQPWCNTWQPGTWGRVALALPGLEQRTVWNRAKTGAELLEAILAFRRAVGISYRSSPGATGQALMRECAPRIDFTASQAPADMPEPAKGNTESDFFWMRPLMAEECGMRYVHAFDKNAMYLAACSNLPLGFGKPEHITGGLEAWNGQPGYWLVTPGHRLAEEWAALPATVSERAARSWVTTPTAEVALQQYNSLGIQDAWIYPQVRSPLTPWARRLRAAREELMHSNSIAYQVMKDSYRWAIGWLNYRGIKDSEEREDLYRPDWRHAIIATARANMYRNVEKAYRASGRAPFAIATDCVYYVSDERHAELFALNGLRLRLGDGVGEYKISASVPLTDVRECVEAGDLRALQRALRGRGEEHGGSNREEQGE